MLVRAVVRAPLMVNPAPTEDVCGGGRCQVVVASYGARSHGQTARHSGLSGFTGPNKPLPISLLASVLGCDANDLRPANAGDQGSPSR
jgi:hypothetical protein